MKITRIELKNFRAFYGDTTIKLKDGKSLLVLGENGSHRQPRVRPVPDAKGVRDFVGLSGGLLSSYG
jgi:hypothetical protein